MKRVRISPHWRFIGLANYRELFADPVTWDALGRAGLFALTSVPLSIVAGLGLAVLINRPLRARALFRTLLYLPAVVPPVPGGRGRAGFLSAAPIVLRRAAEPLR